MKPNRTVSELLGGLLILGTTFTTIGANAYDQKDVQNDLNRLNALKIVEVKDFDVIVPANNCYGHPCPGAYAQAEKENDENAAKLKQIVDFAETL